MAHVAQGDCAAREPGDDLCDPALGVALPAIYNAREYPEVGGMMSYGTSLTEVFRQVAVYAPSNRDAGSA